MLHVVPIYYCNVLVNIPKQKDNPVILLENLVLKGFTFDDILKRNEDKIKKTLLDLKIKDAHIVKRVFLRKQLGYGIND